MRPDAEIFHGLGDLHAQVPIVVKGRVIHVDAGLESLISQLNRIGLDTVLSCIDQQGMVRIMAKNYEQASETMYKGFASIGKEGMLGTVINGFNSNLEVLRPDAASAGIQHPGLAKNQTLHLGIEFPTAQIHEVVHILEYIPTKEKP